MSKEKPVKDNLDQALEKWKTGQPLRSPRLGGNELGDRYEQAIQVLLYEICSRWDREKEIFDAKKKIPTTNFTDLVSECAGELANKWGIASGQVGIASQVAFKFLRFGYAEVMNNLPASMEITIKNSLLPVTTTKEEK